MSIAVLHPQANENSGTSTSSVATSAISHAAGNLLFVFVSWNTSGAMPTCTISNTALDTFIPIDSFTDGFTLIDCKSFYAKNINGNASDTVTVTLGTARTTLGISVIEISGCDPTSPLDQHAIGNIDAGHPVVSGTFTTLQANEILVAGGCAYTEANPQQWIAGTGYTIPSGAASAFGAAVIEYQIVSSIQTAVTAALDWNANNFMNIAVATFKATAIGTTYQQTFDAHLCEFNVRKLA